MASLKMTMGISRVVADTWSDIPGRLAASCWSNSVRSAPVAMVAIERIDAPGTSMVTWLFPLDVAIPIRVMVRTTVCGRNGETTVGVDEPDRSGVGRAAVTPGGGQQQYGCAFHRA